MKIEKTPELTELLQKLNHYQREWMVFRKAFLDEDIKQVMAAPPAASINLNPVSYTHLTLPTTYGV